ncbi:hypothetical protein ABZU75_44425 [Streptosporangium sp. NPDC005286]|uniref:hypothetical protein n=1 Tax=Streptosporangium sp. NPDC005286 TaxID=3154463 RepID=UPI0033BAB7A7
MAKRSPEPRPKTHDLIALFAILAAGVILVAIGVPAESLAAVTIALSALFTAWRPGKQGNNSSDEPR